MRFAINLPFLHQLPDAKELFEVISKERTLLPSIVEKDYWLMHCLWGIQKQGFCFELKGGTSLSKGFHIIERFSEDIDIQIHPPNDEDIKIGKNQDKNSHIESRRNFFDTTTHKLQIIGLEFSRDTSFDDKKMRSAGIRGNYLSLFQKAYDGLKEGILLELGFDQTAPFTPCDITSWGFEKAREFNLSIIDNRAKQVNCYSPEYTFVEKLQTVSTKYRLQQEKNSMPQNFLRHYYDIYKLLETDRVLTFIGSKEYFNHKENRFRNGDESKISKNPAFSLPDIKTRKLYSDEYRKKSTIYFGKQVEFDEILSRIAVHASRL